MKITPLLTSVLVLSTCVLAFGVEPKFVVGEKGLAVDAGVMGNFGFETPTLHVGKSDEKPVFTARGEKEGHAEYASGLQLDFTLTKVNQLSVHYYKATPDA